MTRIEPPLVLLNAASASYFAAFAGHSRQLVIDDTLLRDVARMRADIRRENGGGGMCHLVTEWLMEIHGVERLYVSYLDPNGDVICAAHCISLLADGSIFDPTADQMGEGHDMRVLHPSDPEYGRYRPEFVSDFYPGHPDIDGQLDAWLPVHSGYEDDSDWQDALNGERGRAWHLDDPSSYVAYLEEQVALCDGPYGCADFYGAWLENIRSEHAFYEAPSRTP